MQRRQEAPKNPSNGVAFSANQITSATSGIVHTGMVLEEFALNHRRNDESVRAIFANLEESGELLVRFWQDREDHPNDYLNWIEHDSASDNSNEFSTIPYKGNYEITNFRNGKKTPAVLEGTISVFDPKKLLSGVRIGITPEMTQKIYDDTKSEKGSDTGRDVVESRINQCIK